MRQNLRKKRSGTDFFLQKGKKERDHNTKRGGRRDISEKGEEKIALTEHSDGLCRRCPEIFASVKGVDSSSRGELAIRVAKRK